MISYIFISYSRKDSSFTKALEQELLNKGFQVWIDDRIDFGEEWWEIIVQKIKECDVFVIIMSKASESSKWVKRECHLADKENKTIIPLLLDGDCFPIFIEKQFVDVRNRQLPDLTFYNRLNRIFSSTDGNINKNQKTNEQKIIGKEVSLDETGEFLVQGKTVKENIKHLIKNIKPSVSFSAENTSHGDINFNRINRDILKIFARSIEQGEFVLCPICKVQVKAKNLIRHYDKHCAFLKGTKENNPRNILDRRELIKEIVKNNKPNKIIDCPICLTKVAAKNIIRHYDQNHKT